MVVKDVRSQPQIVGFLCLGQKKKKAKIQGKDVYSGSICGKNATFTSRIAKLLKQNRMEGVYERMKTLFSE